MNANQEHQVGTTAGHVKDFMLQFQVAVHLYSGSMAQGWLRLKIAAMGSSMTCHGSGELELPLDLTSWICFAS